LIRYSSQQKIQGYVSVASYANMSNENVERVINPTLATFVKLDDLIVKYDELLESQVKILNNQLQLFDIQSQLLNIQTRNIVINHGNQKLLKLILHELKDGADQGGSLPKSGTVTSSAFAIIDTQIDPGHPVKSILVKNDGPNPIFITYNGAPSSVGPDIVDVLSYDTRFFRLKKNEEKRFIFNRNVIRNVYLLSIGGDSSYRAELVW